MLKWNDILKFVSDGNPKPDRKVKKSDEEWQAQLTADQYRITRQKATEKPFSSDLCRLFESGSYACVCCGTELFDAEEKFKSSSGWPSFTQPKMTNVIAYYGDDSNGMQRVEAVCNICDAHLGHVFPDGPGPSGLRYCINAISMRKIDQSASTATFGGGCFWCTEAIFQEIEGVKTVQSGYSAGDTVLPTYGEVCAGATGHAEVVQITFDPSKISYDDLVRIHLATHNPTQLNAQGFDKGTQYRSIILTHDNNQYETANHIIEEMGPAFTEKIVTEIKPYTHFYVAEDYHQKYFSDNPGKAYCTSVISPKLKKFRALFKEKLRKNKISD